MRFIDEAKIRISGGHGGPGCVSFRRETFEPRGGPDGGDGGEGGKVIVRSSIQLGTLQDFRYKREYKAEAGHHGQGTNKAGKDGQDIVLKVPVGTVIRDVVTGEILQDFTEDNQTWIACKGGRGGKGNAHFVTSTFQAPKFAQPGEEGESREIQLELKLLADVGIIGFPNAGKSTLISRISAARPKIADYAFTTRVPNLGVVAMEHSSFVVADIPGLIPGAHRGLGLGHKFLKHIERTGLFVHLLDGTQLLEDVTRPEYDEEGNIVEKKDPHAGPVENLMGRYRAIRDELGLFNEDLLHKPEIVVVNKVDTFGADPELVERAKKTLRQSIASIRGAHPIPGEPFFVSAVSGQGIQELVATVYSELQTQKKKGVEKVKLPDDEDLRA